MPAYQYTTAAVSHGLMGRKSEELDRKEFEKLLNEHGAQGWQVKAITSTEVKGRVGPGGVEGLLVTFERRD